MDKRYWQSQRSESSQVPQWSVMCHNGSLMWSISISLCVWPTLHSVFSSCIMFSTQNARDGSSYFTRSGFNITVYLDMNFTMSELVVYGSKLQILNSWSVKMVSPEAAFISFPCSPIFPYTHPELSPILGQRMLSWGCVKPFETNCL